MLYKIDSLTKYSFDLEYLYYEADRASNMYPFLKEYYEKWKEVFKATYVSNLDSAVMQFPNETYYQEVTYGNSIFYLTFDVTMANSIIKNFSSKTIPISLLLNRLEKFNIIPSCIVKSSSPIIAIPFPINDLNNLIIIDGNHRLSGAIYSNKPNIEIVEINDINVLRSIMPFPFECAYYTYLLDSIKINNLIKSNISKIDINNTFLSYYQ